MWENTKNNKIKVERINGFKFIEVIAAPVLIYGSENWALNRYEGGGGI
jgi:hypothetical protein